MDDSHGPHMGAISLLVHAHPFRSELGHTTFIHVLNQSRVVARCDKQAARQKTYTEMWVRVHGTISLSLFELLCHAGVYYMWVLSHAWKSA